MYPAQVAQALHLVFATSSLAQDVTIFFGAHDILLFGFDQDDQSERAEIFQQLYSGRNTFSFTSS
jgi:hypothetical protein